MVPAAHVPVPYDHSPLRKAHPIAEGWENRGSAGELHRLDGLGGPFHLKGPQLMRCRGMQVEGRVGS